MKFPRKKMWLYIVSGFLSLCVITFIIIAVIFYKAMKVNQRDSPNLEKSNEGQVIEKVKK